ncbi:ABC transporter ATP-binding protein [Vibrio gazogenes]|uniref:ABC-type multidrug transport system, ATPase and permease component n=1 Tax=Vibrio gazogenes DSM 21264 = NBRC 103151 TaxID=1123492 RepID=A0A1M5HEL0_VIBGA|nr:ABC transporter ATP-binding protein [Vibrio gazogenes]USP13603.1 ABC transporter ATP-binding protein/permease [Vibrio gazogenes]SHG14374.1 ABC-type multidrug transport system, ATPase and permease component [Vibrio gazogenes DSM 21264] [Vibrio gazogenes DSM 21264 = NBRC 103151]SJN55637.1 Lipid A export ATP-binding/permease protein MsbA [Vibrio gazogenes]
MTLASHIPSGATSSKWPLHAKRRLIWISLSWCLVAALEAMAYTVLAQAITHQQSPVWVLLTACVAILMTILTTRAGFFCGVRLSGDLFETLGQAIARAKLSWLTDTRRAQLAMLASQGIPGFMSVPAHQIQTFLHAPLLPLFLVCGIAWLSGPAVALLTAGTLALSLFLQFKAQMALIESDKTRHTANIGTANATIEFVDHLELLRTTAGPTRAIGRIEQQWQTQEQVLANTNRAAAKATLLSAVAKFLPLACISAYLTITTISTPIMTLALLVLVTRAAAPLGELALAGLGINQLRAAVNDYLQSTLVPTLPEPEATQALVPDGHHLSLKNICQPPVLNQISAEIEPGAHVIISGPSGSGKSTLLELLIRFDDPQSGAITFGGVPLHQMRYAELTSHIAYVAQDPVVFTGTLAENIRLGRAGASRADVEIAARHAMLGHVIDRSPDGIDQPVGHQGSALSGGERQRIVIARALLKAAPVLILDEATAALDEETERQIAAYVSTLPATLIIVTHRDPTIWQPTKIITLTEPTQI